VPRQPSPLLRPGLRELHNALTCRLSTASRPSHSEGPGRTGGELRALLQGAATRYGWHRRAAHGPQQNCVCQGVERTRRRTCCGCEPLALVQLLLSRGPSQSKLLPAIEMNRLELMHLMAMIKTHAKCLMKWWGRVLQAPLFCWGYYKHLHPVQIVML
jgi:hypothetical protein